MKASSRTSFILIATTLLLFTNPALAATYKAKCLTESGEFSSCKLKVGQDRFKATYKSEHQGSNIDIASEQIIQIFRRRYSKEKRESLLSSILGAAFSSLISSDIREKMGLSSEDSEENHEQIGIIYVNAPLSAEMREELIRERTGEGYNEDDTQQAEEEDAEEEDVNQEEYLEEGNTDEDDTQQSEEEDIEEDAEDIEAQRKNNLGIPSKMAIIFDVGDEQDAFALRQELKALTGLRIDSE